MKTPLELLHLVTSVTLDGKVLTVHVADRAPFVELSEQESRNIREAAAKAKAATA